MVEPSRTGVGKQVFGAASQTARLMLYGLLAVVLMAMDQQGHYVSRVRSSVEKVFEPVYLLVDWPVRVLRSAYGRLQSAKSLREDNESLRRELIRQQADLMRYETLTEENRRLRALIEGAAGKRFEYHFAELLNVDLDPFVHRVVINRGSRDGVTPGQAIIDGAGVIGQVEEVRRATAVVRLISDPSHALPVQINRTGLRTVAYGTGETGHLRLPNVPRQADIREGDLVVTSGLGDRFPSGYPVATVTRIERLEGETFLEVEAEPLAALDRGREVLLIEPLAELLADPSDEATDQTTDQSTDQTTYESGDTPPEGQSVQPSGPAAGVDDDDSPAGEAAAAPAEGAVPSAEQPGTAAAALEADAP